MMANARHHLWAIALFSLPLFLLWGCAGTGPQRSGDPVRSTGNFPIPSDIQDNVDFWRNVFGVWSRRQVVFHDEEYLGVIYEIADLPGPVKGGYTPEQRDFVRAKESTLKLRLADMERKIARGEPLASDESALRDKLVAAGGPGVIAGADQRVRTQRGVRERFRRGLEISGRYDAAFRKIFRARGLPADLAYLPHVESSFQVHARSSVGAAGVWQFTAGTGRLYMTVTRAVDERLDPIVSAGAAARYLQSAYARLGSWPLAITSYNHGVGGMEKAKDLHGSDFGRIVRDYDGPAFGFASRNFYAEFLAAREVASHPKKYFPQGIHYETPFSGDRLVLRYSMPAAHIAQHYGLSVYTLSDMNLAWEPPVTRGRANVPAGTTVWLPSGTMERVAGEPGPVSGRIALAESRSEPHRSSGQVRVAKAAERRSADRAARSPFRVARAEPREDAKVRRAASAPKVVRLHVVQPHETLFHVASLYDLSVQELRRLNRIRPGDNTIHPGQRLRVRI
jgi:membrane-bound lytic murein transglycosylase D